MKKLKHTKIYAENKSDFSKITATELNLHALSKRESECLQLIMRGKSARQLGSILGISQRTAEEYINNIKLKFGVSSKAELIEVAVDHLSSLNKLYIKIIIQAGNYH